MSEGVCVDFSTSIEEKSADFGGGKNGGNRAREGNPEYQETKESSERGRIKIGYRRDLNTAYFIVESAQFYCADYQMKMLSNNEIDGILKVKGRGVNGKSRYEYEIQGKHSLEYLSKKGPVTYEMIMGIIEDLLAVIEIMRDYLLSPNQLLLDPRSIFYGDGRYYFCYYPANEQGIAESFHELTEFFVRETDYRDRSGIYVSYALHKMTIPENYQICQVIEEILNSQEECESDDMEEEEYEEEFYEYGDEEENDLYDDWGLEEKAIGDVIREKISNWWVVKHLLRHVSNSPQQNINGAQRNVDYGKKY